MLKSNFCIYNVCITVGHYHKQAWTHFPVINSEKLHKEKDTYNDRLRAVVTVDS